MNTDLLKQISMNLDINDVINLCKSHQNLLYMCSHEFWQDYFNYHHKKLPYTPTSLIEYKLLFIYNQFIPYMELKTDSKHWFDILLKIHNIYYPMAINMVNQAGNDKKIFFTLNYNPILYKLIYNLNLVKDVSYMYRHELLAVFDFKHGYLGINFTDKGFCLKNGFGAKYDDLIMFLVVILMDKKYKNVVIE